MATICSLTTRTGDELTVSLAPNVAVVAIVPVRLEDIKQGSFIGAAAMPQPDGTQRALEVHVFPESMRGTGEGYRPFDLKPQSTMTNGTVGALTGTVGRTLTVAYQGGKQTIVVPPRHTGGDLRAGLTRAAGAKSTCHRDGEAEPPTAI